MSISENQLDSLTHLVINRLAAHGIALIKAEKGELSNKACLFTICLQDSDYNEDWVLIETEQDLASMEESELRKVLSGKVTIGQDDRVFVGAVNGMQRITLN